MIRLTNLLPAQPVLRRRQKLRHIAALRETDTKIQAQRQARLAGTGTALRRSHSSPKPLALRKSPPAAPAVRPIATTAPQALATPQPAPTPVSVPQPAPSVPEALAAPLTPIARAVEPRTRGTYANDFSGRRMQQYSRSNA